MTNDKYDDMSTYQLERIAPMNSRAARILTRRAALYAKWFGGGQPTEEEEGYVPWPIVE